MATERTVTLIGLNLEHDGGEEEPPSARWTAAHRQLLAPRNPDVVFRQEMDYSARNGGRRLAAAEAELAGMRGYLSSTTHRHPTGLFLREATFPTADQYHRETGWRIPPTCVATHLDGLPGVPLHLVAFHAAYNNPAMREIEAYELTGFADKVRAGHGLIAQGGCNEYPIPAGETVPPINWDQMTDRVHRRHRAHRQPDGTYRPITFLDDLLHDVGLHDPARYAAHHLGQTGALAPTMGDYAPQGHGPRIDRFYLDAYLVRAVLEVNVLDTTGITDHKAVEVVLSYSGMREALLRRTGPQPPIDVLSGA